jgi:AraC-like DNA-binding protein
MCSGSAGRNRDLSLNSALLKTMILLPIVTKAAAGQEMGPGWNLLILHHTDCGIKGCYKHAPDLLAIHMHVTREELDALEVSGLRDCCSETGLALADIALVCGFVDQSHFTRVFTKLEGDSPGRWRQRNGKFRQ